MTEGENLQEWYRQEMEKGMADAATRAQSYLDWLAEHPGATDEERRQARRELIDPRVAAWLDWEESHPDLEMGDDEYDEAHNRILGYYPDLDDDDD